MTGREAYRQRLYERRDSLRRIFENKKSLGQDTASIEESIAANAKDIDIAENGSGMSWEREAAVNAAFFAMNGLNG